MTKYLLETATATNTSCKFGGTLSVTELGRICRVLGVSIPTGAFGPSDRIEQPPMVQVRRGLSHHLHVLATGENWRKAA